MVVHAQLAQEDASGGMRSGPSLLEGRTPQKAAQSPVRCATCGRRLDVRATTISRMEGHREILCLVGQQLASGPIVVHEYEPSVGVGRTLGCAEFLYHSVIEVCYHPTSWSSGRFADPTTHTSTASRSRRSFATRSTTTSPPPITRRAASAITGAKLANPASVFGARNRSLLSTRIRVRSRRTSASNIARSSSSATSNNA